MGIFNRNRGLQMTITDLDQLLDLLVNGQEFDAWGSAYYKGIVKKIASTVRVIPRKFSTLNGREIDEQDLPVQIQLDNILAQSSTAVSRFGRAYWGLDTQGSRIVRVRWFNPATITDEITKDNGLMGFTRRVGRSAEPIIYRYDEATERVKFGDNGGLGWVWSLGMNEIGAGDTLDNDVMLPAGLLQASDSLMQMLFTRGGIAKWIAKTEHEPLPADKERIKAALTRTLMGGVSNSNTIEVFSKNMEFQQLSTNPKDLEMEVVNDGNKNDVSAASLTPQMLITPSMASNRSVLDRATSTWLSDVVVPHAQLIVDALNHHIFEPSGFMMELSPSGMSANQEDEVERARAWALYVDLGANPETAAAMLGLDVPDGMEFMSAQPPPRTTGESGTRLRLDIPSRTNRTAEWAEDMRKFRKWVKARDCEGDVGDFESQHLSHADKADEMQRLQFNAALDSFRKAILNE